MPFWTTDALKPELHHSLLFVCASTYTAGIHVIHDFAIKVLRLTCISSWLYSMIYGKNIPIYRLFTYLGRLVVNTIFRFQDIPWFCFQLTGNLLRTKSQWNPQRQNYWHLLIEVRFWHWVVDRWSLKNKKRLLRW